MKKHISFILYLSLIAFVGKAYGTNVEVLHEPISPSDFATFCQYQGMLDNLAEVDKEFSMLLDPPNYPNFKSMYSVVFQLLEKVRKSEKYLETLKDPKCSVSKYTKMLLTYYEANKDQIKENTKNDNSEKNLINIFESLKKEVGIIFLNSLILDKQVERMRYSCALDEKIKRRAETINTAKRDVAGPGQLSKQEGLARPEQIREQEEHVRKQREIMKMRKEEERKKRRDEESPRIQTPQIMHDDSIYESNQNSNCDNEVIFTLMTLIDTVKMLTEENYQLKHQISTLNLPSLLPGSTGNENNKLSKEL